MDQTLWSLGFPDCMEMGNLISGLNLRGSVASRKDPLYPHNGLDFAVVDAAAESQ